MTQNRISNDSMDLKICVSRCSGCWFSWDSDRWAWRLRRKYVITRRGDIVNTAADDAI